MSADTADLILLVLLAVVMFTGVSVVGWVL